MSVQRFVAIFVSDCLNCFYRCRFRVGQIGQSPNLASFLQYMAQFDKMLKESQGDLSAGSAAAAVNGSADSEFSISSLMKMISVKGVDKKSSVLDVVVKTLRDKGEDKLLLAVTQDLQVCDGVSETSGETIERTASGLLEEIDRLKQELAEAQQVYCELNFVLYLNSGNQAMFYRFCLGIQIKQSCRPR
jgi:hypothetical protein